MSEAADDPFEAVSRRWAIAGVLGLVALVFLPVVGFQLVYDDAWTIEANGFLRVPGDLPLLLTPEARARSVPDAFRPASVAFDVLTYQLFGLRPTLHHALSLLLHVGVTGLLARWLIGLRASTAVVLTATALFGVLAIHAEPVAVVSFREDLLAAGLGLVALLLADHAVFGSRTLARIGAAPFATIAIASACLCKMSAAPLPLLWLLAHALRPFGRPSASPARITAGAAALFVGVAIAIGHQVFVFGAIDPYGPHDPGVLAHRIGLAPVLAATLPIHLGYLQQIVVPVGLSPEYTDRGASLFDPATLLAAAALAALFGHAIASIRRRPVLAFAVLGAGLLALPTSNLFAMPNMRADRFMYLPSLPACIGIAVLLVAIGRRLARRMRQPILAIAPAIAMVVIHGAAAQATAVVYRSDRRLWEIAIVRAPDSARAHAVMGELVALDFVQTGSIDAALRITAAAHCRIALALDPDDPLSWLCEGRLAAAERDHERAYRSFAEAYARQVVRRDRVAAALAQARLDRPDEPFPTRAAEAVALLDRAMREAPYSPTLAGAAAKIHHRLGHAQPAADLYARASALRPERWDFVLDRVELQLDLGHPAAAERTLAEHHDRLMKADPARRIAVHRRLALAKRAWPSQLRPASPL